MLTALAAAALLAGAAPAAPPVAVDLSVGWTLVDRTDPFGRAGPTPFSAGMALAGGSIRADSWYGELAGQLMLTSLTNRNVTASVGRRLFTTGRVRWDIGGEFADVRFRREDFRTDDVLVGTSRAATIGMVSIGIGVGPFNGTSVRLTALGGWYANRYGSVLDLPGFSGDEPLADSERPVVGVRAELRGLTLGERIELGASVRWLRLSGSAIPPVPDQEFSGTASLNIRVLRVRRKQLFVGGFARFGPAGPSLITDKTFGLRGIWKLK